MSAAVRIDQVSHGVLSDVSLDARGPALLALTGRSGAGKSTLCHLVAGLERPESGRVLVDGEAPADITDWRRISVLPQRLGLLGALTAAENLALPAQVRGANVDRDGHRALVAALSVETLWSRPVREGSIGEQQRVAVARALALGSALIVLDEPTAHQDDANAERVVAVIGRALSGGSLLVVSTHDPRLLALASTRLALDGRLDTELAGEVEAGLDSPA